jgi:hypothetical protein
MRSSSTVPIPPGATTNASEVSTNWCKRDEERTVLERVSDERVRLLLEAQATRFVSS